MAWGVACSLVRASLPLRALRLRILRARRSSFASSVFGLWRSAVPHPCRSAIFPRPTLRSRRRPLITVPIWWNSIAAG